MSMLRIAVAGAGHIGRRHVELIGQSGQCQLAALVDPAPAAQDYARTAGVPCYPSFGELFARHRPDGVIIASPNALHVPNGLDCIDRNVPVLLEKPIADTVADGERLCDAAERAAVPLLVGHHRRHNPCWPRRGPLSGPARSANLLR